MLHNIEAERARLGLTKVALSKELGITSNTYRGYISGTPIPSATLLRMAELFNCKTDYLLGLLPPGADTHNPSAPQRSEP